MNLSRYLLLIGALSVLSTSVANAAELRGGSALKPLPSFTVSANTRTIPPPVPKVFKHSCGSEGYQCADGYSCKLIMSQSGEDERGNRVSMGGTNQRFYQCNQSGRTHRPSCSKGLIPSGKFIFSGQGDLRGIPGAVTEYFCQIPL